VPNAVDSLLLCGKKIRGQSHFHAAAGFLDRIQSDQIFA
jgi:hypothetical protein